MVRLSSTLQGSKVNGEIWVCSLSQKKLIVYFDFVCWTFSMDTVQIEEKYSYMENYS